MIDAPARPEVLEWLAAFAGEVPDGGWVEVQLAAGAWLRDVLHRLEAGAVLVFDYGDTAENLIPRRQDGTLRTYRAHHLGPHPLDEPGETDITADVNFTALVAVAEEDGCGGRAPSSGRFPDRARAGGPSIRAPSLRIGGCEIGRRDGAAASAHPQDRGRDACCIPRGLGDFRVLVARK